MMNLKRPLAFQARFCALEIVSGQNHFTQVLPVFWIPFSSKPRTIGKCVFTDPDTFDIDDHEQLIVQILRFRK